MTFIAKPIIQDNHILNDVARDCLVITDDPNKVMLRRGFKVLTEDGVIHELTFSQLDGLINILDLSRDISGITPLQYLTATYDIQDLMDLGKDGWVVPSYTIIVMHSNRTVRFEGTLTKPSHVDKMFTFALGDFDFIQQFSLSRTIAAQDERLKDVASTFDMSYTYKVTPEGLSLTSLELGNEA